MAKPVEYTIILGELKDKEKGLVTAFKINDKVQNELNSTLCELEEARAIGLIHGMHIRYIKFLLEQSINPKAQFPGMDYMQVRYIRKMYKHCQSAADLQKALEQHENQLQASQKQVSQLEKEVRMLRPLTDRCRKQLFETHDYVAVA